MLWSQAFTKSEMNLQYTLFGLLFPSINLTKQASQASITHTTCDDKSDSVLIPDANIQDEFVV